MDLQRLCIPGQHHGPVFKEEQCLDTGGDAGDEVDIGVCGKQRHVTQPLVIHSDCGVQYTCRDYEEATAGMERSYSAKACPWDNTCIESFHSLIKREWINRFCIIDYNHAYRLVFEYIEAFYNTVRIHGHCGYHSPSEYEKQYLERKMQETG